MFAETEQKSLIASAKDASRKMKAESQFQSEINILFFKHVIFSIEEQNSLLEVVQFCFDHQKLLFSITHLQQKASDLAPDFLSKLGNYGFFLMPEKGSMSFGFSILLPV